MALKHAITWAANGVKITGSNWNDTDHIVDGGGLLMAAGMSTPTSPSPGNVVLFGRTIAGGALPAYIGSSGASSSLQPFIGRNKVGLWASVGNSTSTPSSFGINAPSAQGSLTQRNVTATSYFGAAIRSGYVSAATAGSSAGPRCDRLQYFRGGAAGLGGFRVVLRFGCSDAATVADARSFAGMVSTTSALGNANPSTNTNIIGVGTDSGESTLSIMHNDGAGTATKIPLGTNFPDHTLSVDLYELALFCAPNSSEVGWEVTRLNTGDTAAGVITSDLPASTQLLAPQIWRNNGTTALAVGVDLMSAYFERDY